MISKNIYRKPAFTLVEIIIVLAVLLILAAALVPMVSRYLPTIQLNGTAKSIVGDLRQAQERAVTEQNQYLIRFFPEDSPVKYQLIHIVNSNEEIITERILPSAETVALDNTIINNQIVFSPDGGPSSSGNVLLTLNEKTKTINISPAGFIKIP